MEYDLQNWPCNFCRTPATSLSIETISRLVAACHSKMKWVVQVLPTILGFCLLQPFDTVAADISEAEFLAAKLAAGDVQVWVDDIQPRIRSIGVFSVKIHTPLDIEYGEFLENEVKQSLRALGKISVVECFECKDPQIRVDGSQLVITKGAPELEQLQKFGQKLKVDAFVTLVAYRTSASVFVQANLFESTTGKIISSRSFRTPAISLRDSSWLFLLNVGLGTKLGGGDSGEGFSIPPAAINISIMDELGFGKGGVVIGATTTRNNGNIVYFLMNLGVRGRWKRTYIHTLLNGGIGYGIGRNKSGVYGRLAYDIFWGSIMNIGAEVGALLPVQERDGSEDSTGGFAGIHFGMAFGR